jgi:predicted porin
MSIASTLNTLVIAGGFVALVASPRLAQADEPLIEGPIPVRVYGFLNAQVERAWARGGSTPYEPRWRVTDGGSRLGFDGAIELGERTKAVWQIEGSLNGFEQGGLSDQGTPAVIVSRNTFVGVEDERFGRLIAGNVDSAYRSLIGSGGAMGGNLGLTTLGLDVWNNTSAQLTGGTNSIFSRGEARYPNSLHYFTPAWQLLPYKSSLQGAASYSFDEALINGRRRDRFSLAGLYQIKGLSLGVGLDYQRNTGINVDNWQQGLGLVTDAEDGPATYFYKAVASYLFPTQTYLGVGFERSNYGYLLFTPPSSSNFYPSLTQGTVRQNGAMASLAQKLGHATIMASAGALFGLDHSLYGRARDLQATQFSFGGKYDFNDLFAAYAYFTSIRNQAEQNVNLGQPVYSNNLGQSDAYMALGDSPHAVGIGIVARF